MKYRELDLYTNIFYKDNYGNDLDDNKTILFDVGKVNNSVDPVYGKWDANILPLSKMLNPIIGNQFSYALDFNDNKMYIFFDSSINVSTEDIENSMHTVKVDKIIEDGSRNIAIVDFEDLMEECLYLMSIYENAQLVEIDFSKLKQAKKLGNESTYDIENNVETLDTSISAISEINKLVGLDEAKLKLSQLIAIAKTNKLREENGLNKSSSTSNHMIFTGNPGTGKTTAAKLFATAMYQNGVIKENKFVSTNRSNLVASFIGQTAEKTKQVIYSAIGGVLFIDEAYTLVKPNDPQDFGSEAIDELLDDMEKYRNNLIVILAGYTEKMEEFLDANPGLRSRIPNRVFFADYSAKDLLEIIHKNIEKEGVIVLKDPKYFDERITSYIENNNPSGNGRWARNLYQEVLQSQAMRVAFIENANKEDLMTVTNDDVNRALESINLDPNSNSQNDNGTIN